MKRATDKLIALQFLAVVLPIAVVLLVQMAVDVRRAVPTAPYNVARQSGTCQ
jgi:hypothetical protein